MCLIMQFHSFNNLCHKQPQINIDLKNNQKENIFYF